MNAPLPNPRADIEMMRAHIELLADPVRLAHPHLRIEIAWSDDTGHVNQAQTFSLNEIEDAVKFAAEKNVAPTNVYVGAILKRADTPHDGRTKASQSALATALAVDIDENARESLAKLCALIKLGALVLTGKTPQLRMQAWLRVEPTDDLATFDALTKRAVAFCGGDTNATGLNRVMRLAGSVSYPPARKRARGYVVELTQAKFPEAPSYALSELLEKFPAAAANDEPARRDDHGFGENTNRWGNLPINPVNVAIVVSMLNALPDSFARNHDDWLRVGFALHDFDHGIVGLELWRKFSKRCPEKAGETDFSARWASFSNGYSGKKITLGSLRRHAEDSGWRSPRQWDRSTNFEEQELEG